MNTLIFDTEHKSMNSCFFKGSQVCNIFTTTNSIETEANTIIEAIKFLKTKFIGASSNLSSRGTACSLLYQLHLK